MELVTLKTFINPIDAHLLKSQLESEGIECFLFDENMVSLNMIYNISVGGIKLKVYKDSLEQALGIIALNDNLALTDENDQPILCPKCGSPKLVACISSLKRGSGFLASLKTALYAIVGVYDRESYMCTQCGYEFKKK